MKSFCFGNAIVWVDYLHSRTSDRLRHQCGFGHFLCVQSLRAWAANSFVVCKDTFCWWLGIGPVVPASDFGGDRSSKE